MFGRVLNTPLVSNLVFSLLGHPVKQKYWREIRTLNLADFTDFFLLATLTSLLSRFTLSVVASVRKLSYGQPNRLGDTKRNAFVLTVFRIQVHLRTFLGEYVIYSFWWTQ